MVETKRERRTGGVLTESGPICEMREKPLVESQGGAYELILPKEFDAAYLFERPETPSELASETGNIGKEKTLHAQRAESRTKISQDDHRVTLYWSRVCRGHLLVSFGQWPLLWKPPPSEEKRIPRLDEKADIRLEDIRTALGVSLGNNAAKAFFREMISAKIEQGLKTIVIESSNEEGIEDALPIVQDMLLEVGGFARVSRTSRLRPSPGETSNPRIVIEIIDDPREVRPSGENVNHVDVLDFRGLTERMLNEVIRFLKGAVGAVRSDTQLDGHGDKIKEALSRLRHNEAYIDFMWTYNCRQLVIGGRYGLFCGLGRYTSITPVALGSFYKLLEHAVDQMMAILDAIGKCFAVKKDARVKNSTDVGEDGIKTFLRALLSQLDNTITKLEMVSGPLLNAIENRLTDEDRKKIAYILKEYHENVKPVVGNVAETYLESTEMNSSKALDVGLRHISIDRAIILAETIYPMQKLCKFPANVAMLAGILNLSKEPLKSDDLLSGKKSFVGLLKVFQ